MIWSSLQPRQSCRTFHDTTSWTSILRAWRSSCVRHLNREILHTETLRHHQSLMLNEVQDSEWSPVIYWSFTSLSSASADFLVMTVCEQQELEASTQSELESDLFKSFFNLSTCAPFHMYWQYARQNSSHHQKPRSTSCRLWMKSRDEQ